MADAALPATAEKARVVRGMFGAIAPRYDLLNHLLSLNRDRAWRRRAVDLLLALPRGGAHAHGRFLDSCAGTLDLTREIASRAGFRGQVIACDFALPMLLRGRVKVAGLPTAVACADALRLPVADGVFDGAIVGFGVRNLASLDAGLRELARVLRPGGRLVILEFTTPARQPLRGLYLLYFRRLLPLIGRAVSKHRNAYTYLPASVLEFPSPSELAALLEKSGFTTVEWETLTGGIVAIHVARRRNS
jgi:demethylmenaquinone methyltransferase/2-methoxy-6-polyprenyl-1,4-benzoquinol methylase